MGTLMMKHQRELDCVRQLGLSIQPNVQKSYPRQIPANHRPDREARPIQEGKQRVIERVVL